MYNQKPLWRQQSLLLIIRLDNKNILFCFIKVNPIPVILKFDNADLMENVLLA